MARAAITQDSERSCSIILFSTAIVVMYFCSQQFRLNRVFTLRGPSIDDIDGIVCTTSGTLTEDGRENITLVSWLPGAWSNKGYVAALRNRRRYARVHGYRFLGFNETNLPPSLSATWRQDASFFKPKLLAYLLDSAEDGTWLVWMDADTLFTNFEIRWGDYLGSGDVVVAEAPDVVTNNGVFALRASEAGRAFVDDWVDEHERYGDSPLTDNGTFIHALLRALSRLHDVEYDNRCRLNEFKALWQCYNERVESIGAEKRLKRTVGPRGERGYAFQGKDEQMKGKWGLNSGLSFAPPNRWEPGSFILHFAGTGGDEREWMLGRYAQVCEPKHTRIG